MTYWTQAAIRDFERGAFYATSLPDNNMPGNNRLNRALYRGGWIVAELATGKTLFSLPAFITESANGYCYWVVDIVNCKPLYNATRGETPATSAGYFDLEALASMKNDTI